MHSSVAQIDEAIRRRLRTAELLGNAFDVVSDDARLLCTLDDLTSGSDPVIDALLDERCAIQRRAVNAAKLRLVAAASSR